MHRIAESIMSQGSISKNAGKTPSNDYENFISHA